jgi:hypothetical protein
MDKELEKKLVEKYPDALSEYGGDMHQTCMAWGFECGDGWYEILEELCEKIANIPGFKFAQVKEKFGMLTVYYDGPDSKEDRKIVRAAIDEAENKSCNTCEGCGERGKLEKRGGWLSTECNKCREIRDLYDEVKLQEYKMNKK